METTGNAYLHPKLPFDPTSVRRFRALGMAQMPKSRGGFLQGPSSLQRV